MNSKFSILFAFRLWFLV